MMIKMMLVYCFVVLRPLPGVPTVSIADILVLTISITDMSTDQGHFMKFVLDGCQNVQSKPISKEKTSWGWCWTPLDKDWLFALRLIVSYKIIEQLQNMSSAHIKSGIMVISLQSRDFLHWNFLIDCLYKTFTQLLLSSVLQRRINSK